MATTQAKKPVSPSLQTSQSHTPEAQPGLDPSVLADLEAMAARFGPSARPTTLAAGASAQAASVVSKTSSELGKTTAKAVKPAKVPASAKQNLEVPAMPTPGSLAAALFALEAQVNQPKPAAKAQVAPSAKSSSARKLEAVGSQAAKATSSSPNTSQGTSQGASQSFAQNPQSPRTKAQKPALARAKAAPVRRTKVNPSGITAETTDLISRYLQGKVVLDDYGSFGQGKGAVAELELEPSQRLKATSKPKAKPAAKTNNSTNSRQPLTQRQLAQELPTGLTRLEHTPVQADAPLTKLAPSALGSDLADFLAENLTEIEQAEASRFHARGKVHQPEDDYGLDLVDDVASVLSTISARQQRINDEINRELALKRSQVDGELVTHGTLASEGQDVSEQVNAKLGEPIGSAVKADLLASTRPTTEALAELEAYASSHGKPIVRVKTDQAAVGAKPDTNLVPLSKQAQEQSRLAQTQSRLAQTQSRQTATSSELLVNSGTEKTSPEANPTNLGLDNREQDNQASGVPKLSLRRKLAAHQFRSYRTPISFTTNAHGRSALGMAAALRGTRLSELSFSLDPAGHVQPAAPQPDLAALSTQSTNLRNEPTERLSLRPLLKHGEQKAKTSEQNLSAQDPALAAVQAPKALAEVAATAAVSPLPFLGTGGGETRRRRRIIVGNEGTTSKVKSVVISGVPKSDQSMYFGGKFLPVGAQELTKKSAPAKTKADKTAQAAKLVPEAYQASPTAVSLSAVQAPTGTSGTAGATQATKQIFGQAMRSKRLRVAEERRLAQQESLLSGLLPELETVQEAQEHPLANLSTQGQAKLEPTKAPAALDKLAKAIGFGQASKNLGRKKSKLSPEQFRSHQQLTKGLQTLALAHAKRPITELPDFFTQRAQQLAQQQQQDQQILDAMASSLDQTKQTLAQTLAQAQASFTQGVGKAAQAWKKSAGIDSLKFANDSLKSATEINPAKREQDLEQARNLEAGYAHFAHAVNASVVEFDQRDAAQVASVEAAADEDLLAQYDYAQALAAPTKFVASSLPTVGEPPSASLAGTAFSALEAAETAKPVPGLTSLEDALAQLGAPKAHPEQARQAQEAKTKEAKTQEAKAELNARAAQAEKLVTDRADLEKSAREKLDLEKSNSEKSSGETSNPDKPVRQKRSSWKFTTSLPTQLPESFGKAARQRAKAIPSIQQAAAQVALTMKDASESERLTAVVNLMAKSASLSQSQEGIPLRQLDSEVSQILDDLNSISKRLPQTPAPLLDEPDVNAHLYESLKAKYHANNAYTSSALVNQDVAKVTSPEHKDSQSSIVNKVHDKPGVSGASPSLAEVDFSKITASVQSVAKQLAEQDQAKQRVLASSKAEASQLPTPAVQTTDGALAIGGEVVALASLLQKQVLPKAQDKAQAKAEDGQAQDSEVISAQASGEQLVKAPTGKASTGKASKAISQKVAGKTPAQKPSEQKSPLGQSDTQATADSAAKAAAEVIQQERLSASEAIAADSLAQVKAAMSGLGQQAQAGHMVAKLKREEVQKDYWLKTDDKSDNFIPPELLKLAGEAANSASKILADIYGKPRPKKRKKGD